MQSHAQDRFISILQEFLATGEKSGGPTIASTLFIRRRKDAIIMAVRRLYLMALKTASVLHDRL